MKKFLILILILKIFIFSFSGCIKGPYPFKESIEEIETIEIVDAEDSFDYTVEKTLSDDEMVKFLKQLQQIEFRKVYGDPIKFHGKGIKITYQSGNYEMFNYFSAEYVYIENEHRYFHIRMCDEDKFNELLEVTQ